ncbi:MAG: hypothetical protein RXR03_08705 [Thermocladium sp.]
MQADESAVEALVNAPSYLISSPWLWIIGGRARCLPPPRHVVIL